MSENERTRTYDPPLEPGIAAAVHALNAAGIVTFTSCEGGPGHAFPEPTVRFGGELTCDITISDAITACHVLVDAGLPVHELRHVWTLAELPDFTHFWEIVLFSPK